MNFHRCCLEYLYDLNANSQGTICLDKGFKYMVVLQFFVFALNIFLVTLLFFFFFFWLCCIFIAVHAGYSSWQCTGFSLQWLLLLQSTGSRHTGFSSCGAWAQQLQHEGSVVMARSLQSSGSVVVAHGLSCSAACGIFLDQRSNQCPLHWQADSQQLRHQGSPHYSKMYKIKNVIVLSKQSKGTQKNNSSSNQQMFEGPLYK